jgi:hypothetical protein
VQSQFHLGARRVLPVDSPPPLGRQGCPKGGRGRPSLRRESAADQRTKEPDARPLPTSEESAATSAGGLASPSPGLRLPPCGGRGEREVSSWRGREARGNPESLSACLGVSGSGTTAWIAASRSPNNDGMGLIGQIMNRF